MIIYHYQRKYQLNECHRCSLRFIVSTVFVNYIMNKHY